MIRQNLAVLILGAALATPAPAQIIDFETDPAGAPSSDDATLGLGAAYAVGPLSIRFGFDGDLNGIPETTAFFEQAGPDVQDGFAACLGRDVAAPGFAGQLGNFFLRGGSGTDYGALIIIYTGGVVSGASGEIWDIDGPSSGTEQYRVRAFDTGGTLLATIDSPLSTQDSGCANTELDGKPWTFYFSATPGIARITTDFIGTKANGIGLAFNDFNSTGEQPAPAEAASWRRVKGVYRQFSQAERSGWKCERARSVALPPAAGRLTPKKPQSHYGAVRDRHDSAKRGERQR